jgi:hypothetical protein
MGCFECVIKGCSQELGCLALNCAHCFYDILRLYSYGWTILPLPQCLMFKQALKSGYNACLKICNNFTANNIPENPASWADLDWFVRGGGGFLLVIGQGELAKGAGSESNSCEQLLSPNYIDNCTLWDGNAICKIFHILFNKI